MTAGARPFGTGLAHLPVQIKKTSEAQMQIRDDMDPFVNDDPSQRETHPLPKIVRRSPTRDDTIRVPMSVLTLLQEPINPELETLQVKLQLPENLDDDDV